MNKQKIIDDFINRRKGIPNSSQFSIFGHEFSAAYFEKRAIELGWINGYQYGVEYKTNGRMPDLPFDLIVEVFYEELPPWQRERVRDALWHSNAYKPIKFRIVDERYKPSQRSKAGKLDIERIDVIGQNGNDGLHYGVKHDSDKPRYDLIPPHSLDEFAKVLTFGAKKYKPNGWRDVERERYVAALGRHWQALLAGETHDQESGLHHGAHLMCCASFIAEMDIESGMEL